MRTTGSLHVLFVFSSFDCKYCPTYTFCVVSFSQWSVGTILMGLYSFMLEEAPTYGSIVTSAQYKRQAAAESLEFNNKNK